MSFSFFFNEYSNVKKKQFKSNLKIILSRVKFLINFALLLYAKSNFNRRKEFFDIEEVIICIFVSIANPNIHKST